MNLVKEKKEQLIDVKIYKSNKIMKYNKKSILFS